MAPPDIECILHDEALGTVDFDYPAHFIGISANVSQLERAREIAQEFRRRGRCVIIGGPHITLDPDAFAGVCDVAVRGEFEDIAGEFFADLQADQLRPAYQGTKPDLRSSPLPAWHLYPNDRALMGVAQTSRGCPFECNFCDVIQYLGRVQRHKDVDQVIVEVQQLYDLGYNRIMLADDNFTVYRKRAAVLLEALAAWNGRDGRGTVTFATQCSIEVGRSPDLLALCAEAGLLTLFVGVETVNEESLKAAKKRQNLAIDTADHLRPMVNAGLRVEAGMIVGFDHDTRAIFEQQYDFAMGLPVGTFKVSSLNAPKSTPLYADMLAAGRIDHAADHHFTAADISTNIVPAQMSREELSIGTRWLICRLFRPESFVQRLTAIAAELGPDPLAGRAPLYDPPQRREAKSLYLRMIRYLSRRDPAVAAAIGQANALMRERPECRQGIGDLLGNWLLALHNYVERGLYDEEIAALERPNLRAPVLAA
ncbi:MAG: B12-binding domain-containing radical SAM protein [Tsuneonella sp.]